MNKLEDFFHGPWHDASLRISCIVFESLHGMCLARACLPICHYGCIETFQDRAYSTLGSILVNKLLSRIRIVHIVKTVCLPHTQVRIDLNIACSLSIIYLSPKVLHDGHTSTIWTDLDNREEKVAMLLPCQWWSHPNHDFEVLLFVLFLHL